MSYDQRLIATLRQRYRGLLGERVSDAVILHAYFYWRLDGVGEQAFGRYVTEAKTRLRA
jgi:hypothetical protein